MKLNQIESPYFFCICQKGGEEFIKKEMEEFYSYYKLSFSSKGLVSFKSSKKLINLETVLDFVFSRLTLIFLKKGNLEDIKLFIQSDEVYANLPLTYYSNLEIKNTDTKESAEPKPDAQLNQRMNEVPRGFDFIDMVKIKTDQPFMSLIQVKENEYWLGIRKKSVLDWDICGGEPKITMPSQSPSRAYLKIEEALYWSKAPILKSDLAIEVGSAPGGACYSLLERGLKVVGIDAAEMSPVVMAYPQFKHIQSSVHFANTKQYVGECQWLLLDMNNKPRIALPEALKLVELYQSSLLGVFLTLKINELSFIQYLTEWRKEASKAGLKSPRITQLPSHKSEILLYALTAKGKQRLSN